MNDPTENMTPEMAAILDAATNSADPTAAIKKLQALQNRQEEQTRPTQPATTAEDNEMFIREQLANIAEMEALVQKNDQAQETYLDYARNGVTELEAAVFPMDKRGKIKATRALALKQSDPTLHEEVCAVIGKYIGPETKNTLAANYAVREVVDIVQQIITEGNDVYTSGSPQIQKAFENITDRFLENPKQLTAFAEDKYGPKIRECGTFTYTGKFAKSSAPKTPAPLGRRDNAGPAPR